MALPCYFGQCLIQQLVLPYKPWYLARPEFSWILAVCMSTTSMAIFSNPLFASYSVYARNASVIRKTHLTFWPNRSVLDYISRCLVKQRMMEVVVTTGAVGCAKLQSNHNHQQTQHLKVILTTVLVILKVDAVFTVHYLRWRMFHSCVNAEACLTGWPNIWGCSSGGS